MVWDKHKIWFVERGGRLVRTPDAQRPTADQRAYRGTHMLSLPSQVVEFSMSQFVECSGGGAGACQAKGALRFIYFCIFGVSLKHTTDRMNVNTGVGLNGRMRPAPVLLEQ